MWQKWSMTQHFIIWIFTNHWQIFAKFTFFPRFANFIKFAPFQELNLYKPWNTWMTHDLICVFIVCTCTILSRACKALLKTTWNYKTYQNLKVCILSCLKTRPLLGIDPLWFNSRKRPPPVSIVRDVRNYIKDLNI